jgi:peptidoglycan/LPS O-acetylase OafA/YrhL
MVTAISTWYDFSSHDEPKSNKFSSTNHKMCILTSKFHFPDRFAVAFSLKKNTKALFAKREQNDIRIAHAIRLLNAIMLVVAHRCMAMFYGPYSNRTSMMESLGRPYSVLARAASLYTDPFLMLSGMLTAYSLFDKLQKNGKINIWKEYVSRYLRIMPSFAFLIAICTYILPLLGNGPMWNLVVSHHADICKKYWWRNLLFIHNWFGFSNMCLTHTHHLGIDTELFLIAPFMTIALYKWPKKALNVICILAVISTIARYYVTYTYDLTNYVSFGSR